ncbi:MAG: nucleotide exchange factor GrpE [Candidatus Alcyoniella australis]|nr:nucleotide exchange factor GrpE [Candidatus Alcyoniella australis]
MSDKGKDKKKRKIEVKDATEQVAIEPEEQQPEQSVAQEQPLDPQARIDELTDRLQRLAAEFDNFRKRSEREKAQTADWARAELLKALMPVLDGLDRAVHSVDGIEEPWAEGLRTLQRQTFTILHAQGLEEIPTQGKLDPNVHEVFSAVPMPGVEPEHIVECCEPGYTLHGRLVRPARVIVAKQPPEQDDQNQETGEPN